jgi:cellulose synthase/poly-beta-1,6-N-acetylglucosamine synthase-like glycosyltransferase
MDENWIKAYQNCINEKNPDFIIAPVLMQAKNYFERLQSLEFFSLIVSGGAAALKNKAIMCNGANLGFKKELFFENQNLQNQKFASGDDMMLLMAAKKSNKKIEFCFSTDICVQTKAQSSLKAFFAQRLRWASKGPFYSDFDVVYTALLVLSLNMFIAFFLVSGFFIFPYFIVGIVMLLFKSIVDFLFLKIAAKSFQQKKRIPDFLIIQLVYPFYIMVSASGMFFKPKWKGRIIV